MLRTWMVLRVAPVLPRQDYYQAMTALNDQMLLGPTGGSGDWQTCNWGAERR